MSAQSVETILSRAMSDAKFADSLFANPETVLSAYDLTVEEVTALKNISPANVEAFAKASPEERKSFGWANHNESTLQFRQIIR